MGRKLFTNFKCCQNCRYWCGAREIDGFAKMTESIDDSGICSNTDGFYNQDMNKQACCSHFEAII